ncbi:MAG: RpiB/LacA/LacB family sugar-phosphate isomerase [bacterium]|nr:RpiB/LacA/LacB family sugar-phosphate isomerase [bacterium]
MIYIGADHRGFELKEILKKWLIENKVQFFDVGAIEEVEVDDYPDFAAMVAKSVASSPEEHKGILVCGSGHGVDMVANKYKGVRSALAFKKEVAIQSRAHENANVLTLPADWLKPEEASEILDVWLRTNFDNAERNQRRLGKIDVIEGENFK